MPKRGTYRGGRNNNNSNNNNWRQGGQRYNEHDDRDRPRPAGGDLTIRKDTNRRVSFKTTGLQSRQNKLKSRAAEMGLRVQLEEDDDMTESQLTNKAGFRGADGKIRRRGSPIPRKLGGGPRGVKTLVAGSSEWYQVMIPYGHKYDKDFILKLLLQAISPEIFIPHYWKTETANVTFYVDEYQMAKRLALVDRTIELPDGFKLIIKVRNGVPPVKIDARLREQMKMAMVKRYSPATKALDLTKFHSDQDLRDEVFCALFRPPIFLAAVDIIAENIPDLEALNLNNNKIYTVDHFKTLFNKLPNLRILYLENNKISGINSLDSGKQSNITELVLKGNPIRDRYRDNAVYVRYHFGNTINSLITFNKYHFEAYG